MADLQAVLMDNDALDDELQNRLLVGKAGILQTVMGSDEDTCRK